MKLSGKINDNGNIPASLPSDQIIVQRFFLGLLAYFLAHTILRVLVSSSLEIDEAEQVLFSQWLRAGYGAKPPLYTWLQIIFFKIFGVGVLGLSLLKNGLLLSTYLFVFLSARSLFKNSVLALLAALSLLLIPQISWESQRDLTHSVLVTALSAMSFYIVLQLLESGRIRHYLALGLLVGLGTLAKLNYLPFACAMLLTLLTFSKGRSVLLHRRALLSLAVAFAIVLPYLIWINAHLQAATSSVNKLNILTHGFILKGSARLITASISFLAPLCLFYLLFFRRGALRALRCRAGRSVPFPIHHYFFLLLGLLWAMVLFFGVTHFKGRWMLPLYFPFPLYFLTYVSDEEVNRKVLTRFIAVSLSAALAILIVAPARIVIGPSLGYYTSFNYPYAEAARKITEYCPDADLIVADRPQNAGNLRLQLPHTRVLAPTLEPLRPDKRVIAGKTVVFWNASESRTMPSRLKAFLRDELSILPERLQVTYARLPYKYSNGRRHAWVALGLLQ